MYKKESEGDLQVYYVGDDSIRAEWKCHAMDTGSLGELFIFD